MAEPSLGCGSDGYRQYGERNTHYLGLLTGWNLAKVTPLSMIPAYSFACHGLVPEPASGRDPTAGIRLGRGQEARRVWREHKLLADAVSVFWSCDWRSASVSFSDVA